MATKAKKSVPKRKSAPASRPGLHLPSLKIENFRGLKNLEIPHLGRVTLLAGKNGVGKTTVLESVRLYAACGRQEYATNLLMTRDEVKWGQDEYGEPVPVPDWESLFFGRQRLASSEPIAIGAASNGNMLRIKAGHTNGGSENFPPGLTIQVFSGRKKLGEFPIGDTRENYLLYRRYRTRLPYRPRFYKGGTPPEVKCLSLGPDVPGRALVSDLWNEIVIKNKKDWVLDALSLVAKQGGKLEQIEFLAGPDPRLGRASNAQFLVKTKDYPDLFPLKGLGDGAFRLFAIALALVNARDGFLVIDEVENGLHHSIMYDFWKLVLQTAHDNNVQVLAATHGWSCVTGFARAANDVREAEGILVRIDRDGDKIRTVEYKEKDLLIAAEQGIEVR